MSMFFTKVADRKPEKRLHQRCFPVSLPNITALFIAKHIWVVTASAKYHSFSLLHRPHQQNVTLDLGYILIIFKCFQSKHCESLVNSCFWKSQTILLMKQAIRPKCSQKSEAVDQQFSLKLIFFKTSQFSRENICH